MTFFFVWQAEFGMCFGVLGKHFLRLGIVLVQKSLQLTVLNLPEPIFTLLVIQVKIVVIEPAKPISARCFR